MLQGLKTANNHKFILKKNHIDFARYGLIFMLKTKYYLYVSFTEIIFTGQALAAKSQLSAMVWSGDFKV